MLGVAKVMIEGLQSSGFDYALIWMCALSRRCVMTLLWNDLSDASERYPRWCGAVHGQAQTTR